MDDLGHPLEPGYNHWVAWNITLTECIPGGIAKGIFSAKMYLYYRLAENSLVLAVLSLTYFLKFVPIWMI